MEISKLRISKLQAGIGRSLWILPRSSLHIFQRFDHGSIHLYTKYEFTFIQWSFQDNPADFSFFFDTSSRRTCYVAPERFYKAGTEIDQRMVWKRGIGSFELMIRILSIFDRNNHIGMKISTNWLLQWIYSRLGMHDRLTLPCQLTVIVANWMIQQMRDSRNVSGRNFNFLPLSTLQV